MVSSDKSNGLNNWSKLACFVGLTFAYTKCTCNELVKMGAYVLANFSKMAERNKTPSRGNQVRLKLSSHQKTDRKSVHSTRRFFKINVPYKMTKTIISITSGTKI